MTKVSPSILVVDDEADTCRNLSDILTDLGYHVDTALDGFAALELARNKCYDIALLDLKMPGMDGLTLYRELRQLCAETVAIVVTAYATKATAEEALAAGAWQVLPKPVDSPRLLELVEEALGQPLLLVVDDDHDLCTNLWDLLRERDYRVAIAHDEEEAARLLGEHDFTTVLIDMKLPRGNGSGVFQRVRQTNPQARTVVITGHPVEMDPVIQRVVAEGADAVCYKPFDVPRLLATLQRLTGMVQKHGRKGNTSSSAIRPQV
jgi:two-component system response regulator HydG